MFSKLLNFINQLGYDLFYENGSLSLSKVAACWGYLVFTGSSLYLMITGQTWSHYTEFATYMAGTSTFILTGNKFINSKYNSVIGGYGTSDGTHENIRVGERQAAAQLTKPIQEKIDTVNQTINKASETYNECLETANKVVNTIDNAKQTVNKIENGIKTVFNSSSIREGINLAKNTKSK